MNFRNPIARLIDFSFAIVVSIAPPVFSQAPTEFTTHVAPILEQRCVGCHNETDRKGGFSLHSSEAAFASDAIRPNDAEASHLVELISPVNGEAEMPQGSEPLSPEEVAVIRAWIDAGAPWPEGVRLETPVADLNWWSLRPLRHDLKVPQASRPMPDGNPIDGFVRRKIVEKGLRASPPADRRTLIRRLYFDLIGLPPTPERVDEFLRDESKGAYERLVDRLLASKQYGEHWARHWLDVVHYADTHGYDKDKLRPNAWPYRDYVIRALNSDKAYSRFVQEQIAGDVLWPNTVDGIVATGFIAAGPWDFIGHAEVPESKIDGKIARHLDRDDMVSSTMTTFCSITVQCARCHNHKFDPVTQEHYYSLQAVFAALDRADRVYDDDPEVARIRVELTNERKQLELAKKELDKQLYAAAGPQLKAIEDQLKKLAEDSSAGKRPEFGYHSQITANADTTKWVQVDLGKPVAIDTIRFVGCHDDFNGIGHGFGFPLRFRIDVSNDEQFVADVTTVANHTQADFANPGTAVQTVELESRITARFVRMTATQLAERSNDYIFAVGELMVFSQSQNVAIGKNVSAMDSIEAPVRWRKSNLVDGFYYGSTVGEEGHRRIVALRDQKDKLIKRHVSEAILRDVQSNRKRLEEVEERQASLPALKRVYAGTIHHGSGAFAGRGERGGTPRDIHVLARGDVLQPLELVGPGTIPIVAGKDWRFDLPATHSEGDRRVALAKWLTARDNPLIWRSIVNRVWQYHFGHGLVDSPNDFGRMGKLPTHPELLDWLAAWFRDGGQSLKRLHRLLVTSATYRQVSDFDVSNAAIDGDNQFLWRMNRRRLSAEELRDAVLTVSGKLKVEMYGPGFQLFKLERPEHSPHYEYHKFDPDDERSHRRSIYRFVVRSQPDPFMSTLDCADSSQSVAKRDETITALQALSLLNNQFMLGMSEHFAERIQSSSPEAALQIARAFRLVTGRDPDEEEQGALIRFAEDHGKANMCRLLFNLNEFVFVD